MLGQLLKPILQAYFLLEEQYYKLLDVLEERFSVPIYEYFVEPIESRGIPSFIVALLLLLLLVGGSMIALIALQAPSLSVSVFGRVDSTHTIPLDGAVVEVSDETGLLFSKNAKRGRASFENIPIKLLKVRASRDGFKEASGSIDTSEKYVLRLELACVDENTCKKLSEELNNQDKPPYPSPTANPGVIDYPGGGNNGNWSFCDADAPGCDDYSDSGTGRLLILVRDTRGQPVDSRASVYDAKTNGLIETVDVVQGSGLLPSLQVGRSVYVNVFAEGFSPYFGKESAVTIRPATNKLTVTLRAGNDSYVGPCSPNCDDNGGTLPPDKVRIFVVSSNGNALDNAEVSVFVPNRPEVLYTDYTYDGGKVLLTVGTGSYFAVAQASGHITNNSALFQGGQTVTIVLPIINGGGTCTGSNCNECTPQNCPDPGQNEAQVMVNVKDENNANAAYADVVLQRQTEFGSWYVVGQQSANNEGKARFARLLIGSHVKAKASLYEQNGEAEATLVQGINQLNIVLARTPFRIKAFGYDPLERKYVALSSFLSLVGGRTVGQCQGNGCDLTVISGQDVTINVSAEGYIGSQRTVYLYDGVDTNVTLYLVNATALADTFVQWDGLYTPTNRPVSGNLKPGRSYLAKLQLFSRNADQSGVVLDTQNDDVKIVGLDPLGFSVKGSYAENCYSSAVDFERNPVSWADSRYSGPASGTITFNVSLDPDMSLDARTKTKVLSFAYRSYIVRGTDYLRNPFDPDLATRPGDSHPSGCPALSYASNYTVKSTTTTCNSQACVSLRFAQGSEQGSDGFVAENQVLVNKRRLKPFIAYYIIELFARPDDRTSMLLSAPASNIIVFNATTPLLGSATIGAGKRCDFSRGKNFEVWRSSVSLNLSELTSCTNYALPLRFEGVATGRVLQAGIANVSLKVDAINNTNLEHSANVTVTGFGVSADETGIVEAELTQEGNQMSDANTYSALSTGNCTATQVAQAQCDAGFINASFRITALGLSAISPQASAGTGLSLHSITPLTSMPATLLGQAVQGTALFLSPENSGSTSITIRRDASASSTTLTRAVQLGGEGFSFNGSAPFPPGWDTCNGYIGLRYSPAANPPFSLGQGCTDLAFRVTPIFPADAILLNVSIPDFGQILTRVSATDGSEKCYQICDLETNGAIYSCGDLGKTLYSGQQYALRYNPEMRTTCPNEYKVIGNQLRSSQITLEFVYTGDLSNTARRNVTLHVMSDSSDSSLYISPVYTMYSSTGRLYPQLWAVTNLKQLGPRTILFKQPSNIFLTFEGPGTQVVALMGGNVQVFDGSDLVHPLLDLSAPLSPLAPVSRYSLALAAIYRSIDLNIPGFQDYSRALASTLDITSAENAFLDTNAATALSGSASKLAGRTAYWRSSDVTRYCEQSSACISSYNTLPQCCRETQEAWKNTTVQIDFRQDACTFCNNTYNPNCAESSAQHLAQYGACTYGPSSSIFQCDQRCIPKTSIPPYMQDAVNQLGISGSAITIRNYGEPVEGQSCQLYYSSLNAFVEFGTNQFTYYVPSQPLAAIKDRELQRCTDNGNCPIALAPVSTVFVSPIQPPLCATDANNDGLWQPQEATTPTNFRGAVTCNAFVTGCTPRPAEYYCQSNQIIAIEESRFFTHAVNNGVLTPRSIATQADIQRCRRGPCPLMITPATEAYFPNTPMCFTGPTENGFLTATTAGRASFEPAVATLNGAFQCTRGNLAVAKQCFFACNNFCNQPNCDPSPLCLAQGSKIVPTGTSQTIDNGWLNQSPVVPVRMDTAFLSRGKKLAPASYFPDMYQASRDEFQSNNNGKPVFSASYLVNSKNAPNGLDSLPALLSAEGCGGSDYPYDQTLLPKEGVYQIRDYSTIDNTGNAQWASEGKAVDLAQNRYVGTRAETCRKPNWNTRLCEVTFIDSSSAYGNCFNSILQYSAGPKKPGVDLPLVGGLGLGVKSGVGYAVATDGQVFALADAGQRWDNICGGTARGIDPTHGYDEKHKYDVDKQTLHHWRNDGRYDTSRDFYWQRDRGCSKDCGCSKGGYGLLALLIPLLIMALAFFVIGPAIAAATTTYTAVGTSVVGGVTVTSSVTASSLAAATSAFTSIGGAVISTATTVGISAATAGAISAAVLTAATSGLTGGAGSAAATAVNVASNVMSSVGVGNLGDCIPWSFGTVTVWACKGVLWSLSGG